LPPVVTGRDWVTERHLRLVAAEASWMSQRARVPACLRD
jgi:hypothetical protein